MMRSRMAAIRSSLSGCVLRYRSISLRRSSSSPLTRITDDDDADPSRIVADSRSVSRRRSSLANASNVDIILGPASGSKQAPVSNRMPISSASYSIVLLYGRLTASSAAASAPTIADADAGADLLGASLVVLAAEAAHAIAPRGPCRVATRVVRAAVWTSTAALASGAVKSWCHRVANEAMAERRRRLEGGAKEGADVDDDDEEEERFETPPARSSADPELFVNTH